MNTHYNYAKSFLVCWHPSHIEYNEEHKDYGDVSSMEIYRYNYK